MLSADDGSTEGRSILCGGPVDRSSVTLSLHGEDLLPDEITRLLGCSPTHSHRRGEPRQSRSARAEPWKKGAWLLQLQGDAPTSAGDLLADLLGRVPDDEVLWSSLTSKYQVAIGLGRFLDGCNRGMVLEVPVIQRLARMGVALDFDIYASIDEDPRDASPPAATGT
jgi:Domain of unknown function (DUF4279)